MTAYTMTREGGVTRYYIDGVETPKATALAAWKADPVNAEQVNRQAVLAKIDAAIAACEATVRRALAARMSSWSPARLSAYAAERGAQCVLTKDPTMPGGVRIDFVPTHIPAFLAPERTQ